MRCCDALKKHDSCFPNDVKRSSHSFEYSIFTDTYLRRTRGVGFCRAAVFRFTTSALSGVNSLDQFLLFSACGPVKQQCSLLFVCLFVFDSFTGVAPGRRPALNFSAGDQIEVSQRSDPEWWQVRPPGARRQAETAAL